MNNYQDLVARSVSDPAAFGELYDHENNVGNIMDLSRGKKMKASHISWLTWDPFDFNQCRKCKVLPLCMGGCPHKGMKINGGRPECSEIRFNLESIVKNHYRCVKIKEYCKMAFDQAHL